MISYDHRGVGSSSRLEGPITIAELAADAAGLIRALELDSVHVLGISMGGMVAQELVLAEPELVRTVTLGCTYCGGPESSYGTDVARAAVRGDELGRPHAWPCGPPSRSTCRRRPPPTPSCGIATRRSPPSGAVAVAVILAQAAACAQHDTHDRLPGVETPTLVIHGTADELIPVDNGRLIASLIPGAGLEIFDGVGHLFFWEEPVAAAELVRSHAAVPA